MKSLAAGERYKGQGGHEIEVGGGIDLILKLILSVVLLSAPGAMMANSQPEQPEAVTVIDPEQDKVIRAVPNSDRIMQAADRLLRQRKVYGGLQAPEGLIVRIPLPGGRRVAAGGSTFTISEMLLIKRKNTDDAVIVLFDPRHHPYLYAADRAAASRLFRMLEL